MTDIITLDCRYENSRPIITLFIREGNERKIKKITNVISYFFIEESEKIPNKDVIYIEEKRHSLFHNNKIYKVVCNNYRNWWNTKKKYKKTYEQDISVVRRWFIDNVKTVKPIRYRKLFIDIETLTQHGFPEYTNPIESISVITIYDNYTNTFFTYCLEPPELSETDKIIKDNLFYFKDEKEMLQSTINKIYELKVDIILGWNIGFDLSYLFSRCSLLNVDYRKIAYNKELNIKGDKEEDIYIRGMFTFDLLLAYKYILFSELPSYSLDNVAEKELGEGKGEKILDFTEFWKNNNKLLIEYNRKDVDLIRRLEEKLKLVEYRDILRAITGVPDIISAKVATNLIDTLLLRKFGDKYVFPTKHKTDEKVKIAGGYLLEPRRNMYDWVAVYDFKSLYPHIIKTFNLSIDTYNPNNYDFTTCEDSNNLTGYWSLEKDGILIQLLDTLISLRNEYKKERDKYEVDTNEWIVNNIKQYAIKAPLNAIYGINLYSGFRLYKPVVGATITYLGRELSKYVKIRVEEEYKVEVLAQDTDSLFIHLKKYDLEMANKIKDSINTKYVNEFIEKITNQKKKKGSLYIELEKIYERVLLVKKRRYIGKVYMKDDVLFKDKWEYKGVDIRRSNTPLIIKEGLSKFIEILFKGDPVAARKFVREYKIIIENSEDIQKFQIPLKITKEYKTSLPQQRAAKYANEELNLKLKIGSKFYGVWVTHSDTDIIGFDTLTRLKDKNIIINRRKYIEDFEHKINILYDLETSQYNNLLKWC